MTLRIARLFTVLLLCPLILSAQTNIAVPAASGPGIKMVLPERLGINLGNSTNYGNSQLTANLLTSSFAPQIWMTASICASGTTTTWADFNTGSPQPANFYQGMTYQVVSGADAGNTGTITSSTAATGSVGVVMTGSFTTGCSPGDQMILRGRTPFGTYAGGLTPASGAGGFSLYNIGGSGAVTYETADLSPSSTSIQGLQLFAPTSSTAGIAVNFDSNVPVIQGGYTSIDLNGTYTLSFRAKATAGTPTLNYQTARIGGATWLNSNVTPTVNATPGAGWTNYSFTFTASETGAHSAAGYVVLIATGGTVLLEDVALTEAPTGGNTTAFRNAVYQELLSQKPGILRYMDPSIWGCTFDNMISSTPNLCGYNSYANYGYAVTPNLNDFLALNVAIGSDPWWTFSVYSTPADMANMAAYFSGTCGNGNAYTTIRCNYQTAHGLSTASWTSQFSNIYLEFGNEIWNGPNGENLFEGTGYPYGQLLGANDAAFKASPYYTGNMKLVGSGFINNDNGSGSWTGQVLTAAQTVTNGLPDYIDGAPYAFGALTDTSSNANIFNPMFAEVSNYNSVTTGVPNTGQTYQLQNYAHTNFGVDGAVYETNIGTTTTLSSVSQSTINNAIAGVGSGLDATLNMLLAARDAGVKVQNFFILPGSDGPMYTATSTSSGSTTPSSTIYSPIWASNRFMPGPGSTGIIERPTGIAFGVMNRAIGSKLNLLNTVQTGTPTYSQAAAQPNPSAGVQFTANCNGTTAISSINITAGQFFGFLPQYVVSTTGVTDGTLWVSYNASAHTGVLANACTAGTGVSFSAVSYGITANAAVPYVDAFGFGDGAGNYSLIVYNTDLTGSQAITFPGAGAPAGTVTKTVFTSTNITDNNEGLTIGQTPVVGVPTPTTISNPTGDTLPPFSMTTYTWSSLPTIAVESSLNPSTYGQAVTLTATLTSGFSAPTGSVTFLNGATAIGTAPLTATGANTSTATLTTSALPVGSDGITATYGAATSPVLSQMVNAAPAAAAANSSQNPSTYGQATTLTATLSSAYSPPTGSVVFMNGATAVATAALTPGSGLTSTAALTTSTLPVGTDPITANYAATSNFSAAVSPAVSQVVSPASTTAAAVSSLNPSIFSQSVTLTATLSSGYAAPTGSVTFMNGGTALGTATLTPSGSLTSTATLTTTTLPVGTDSVTVVYAATANFGGSTSAAVSQVVSANSTTASVTSSLSPSAVGQSVTFTATVSSGTAPPTGSVVFMNGATVLGTVTLVPGGGLSSTATFSTTTLPAGTNSVTVVYAATPNFGGATSPVLSQMVTSTSTTAAVASSQNPSSFKQSVTFTATLSSASAAPTGSVVFMSGATSIGSGTLTPGSGLSSTATLTTSSLALGTDAITVVYASTPNFAAATSPVLSQVVNPASSAASVTSSSNPAGLGQSVTFTATLASLYAAPTGTVVFMNGATAIGTVVLTSGGGLASTATLSTSALPTGTDAITVVYAATTDFTAATSPVLNQVINAASTTATVTSSLNPASGGQSVTFTATLSSGSAAPTGSVVFMNGATAIGTVALTAGGGLSSTATLTTSALPTGTNSITVVYAATPNFGASTSAALSQVVSAPSTTASVASSLNPSSIGQSVTFTATLFSGSAAPTGTVLFKNGTTTIGSATLTAGSGLSSTATLTTSALALGTSAITAVYAATPNFGASTSAVLSQVVNAAGTSATVASSLSPSSVGQPVTLTATLTSAYAAPTGSVTFMNGGTAIGSATLTAGSGLSSTATFATSALPLGTDSITAVYAATPNFGAATSAALSQVVSAASSTAAVASSLNPSSSNQPVTFTATVSSSYAAPTGSVTFMSGGTALGSATLTPGSGLSSTATLITSTLPVGSNAITAVYAGTANFGGSTSAALSQVVNTATSTTATATSSANPVSVGQSVTLTATVVGVFAAPTGPVLFMNGATPIGSATLIPGGGLSSSVTMTTSALPVGTSAITVVYSATQSFGGATSGVLSQVVNPASTTAAVISSLSPATVGQPVTLTATLSSSYGAPTGSVVFMNGGTAIGTATLASSGGQSSIAALTTSALPTGTNSITVVYAATQNFAGATSTVLSQIINSAGTTETVASSLNPAGAGQPVAFTATVVTGTSGSGSPTGSITFSDGSTVLASPQLVSSGPTTSVASFSTGGLAVGSHPVTATYVPTGGFSGSSASLMQIVNGFGSTTSLSVSPNPTVVGQTVTLTAAVSGSAAIPGGTVAFYSGAALLGSVALDGTGHASYTTAGLPVGTDTLTAAYSGSTIYTASASAAVSETIQAGAQDFTMALASPSVTVQTEYNLTTSATLGSVNGFADTLALSCANLPIYITCRATPSTATLAANGTATVSLYIDTDAVLGYARNNFEPLRPTGSPVNMAMLFSPLALLAGFAAFPMGKSRGRARLRLFLLLLLAALPMTAALSGCASASVSPAVAPPSAAAGTYTVPITATGSVSGISHTVQLTVTVTP